jgi:hypothetical protein
VQEMSIHMRIGVLVRLAHFGRGHNRLVLELVQRCKSRGFEPGEGQGMGS